MLCKVNMLYTLIINRKKQVYKHFIYFLLNAQVNTISRFNQILPDISFTIRQTPMIHQ